LGLTEENEGVNRRLIFGDNHTQRNLGASSVRNTAFESFLTPDASAVKFARHSQYPLSQNTKPTQARIFQPIEPKTPDPSMASGPSFLFQEMPRQSAQTNRPSNNGRFKTPGFEQQYMRLSGGETPRKSQKKREINAEMRAKDQMIAGLKEQLNAAQEENILLQKEILNLKTENNHLFKVNQKSLATTNALLKLKLL
jgi:hypothetical protein